MFVCEPRIEVIVKIQKSQGESEPRIEVIVKMPNKWGGGCCNTILFQTTSHSNSQQVVLQ